MNEWRRSLAGFEPVPDPGFGDDVTRRGGIGLEFLAELADEDSKILDLLGALSAPDCAEKSAVVDDFSGPPRQVDEELEFLRCETNLAAADCDFVGGGVDAEVSDLDNGVSLGFARDAAKIGADSGKKFIHAEGLGHVVIGTSIKGFHFLLLLVADRENDDRDLRVGADRAAELDSVNRRH